jgi:ribose 5-phosphate isomerase B
MPGPRSSSGREVRGARVRVEREAAAPGSGIGCDASARGPTSWDNRRVAPRELPSEDQVRALVARIVDAVTTPVTPEAAAKPPGGATNPSIAVGADHGGYRLKERIVFKLREAGHTVVDCGTNSADAVDYPTFAVAVARKVATGECAAGIVVDGAGIGSAMAANKVAGVRAALCYDISSARNSREHNHANVLTLGAGLIGESLAWQIVEAWLETPWGEGRHARRVAMIDALDGARLEESA